MPRNKKLYIFDMDGTLIDSSQVIVNAINYVRANMNLPPMQDDFILRSINEELVNPAKHFYEIEAFEPIHEEWFSSYYSAHHNKEIALYEGIDRVLEELKSKDVKLAIATNAYRVSALESLKHTGIYELFDEIVTSDDVGKVGKPNPKMLYRVLQSTSLEPHQSLFIGDSHKDRIASQKANIDFLMVNWGFSNHEIDAIDTTHTLYDLIV